jgi:hypothetical protein
VIKSRCTSYVVKEHPWKYSKANQSCVQSLPLQKINKNEGTPIWLSTKLRTLSTPWKHPVKRFLTQPTPRVQLTYSHFSPIEDAWPGLYQPGEVLERLSKNNPYCTAHDTLLAFNKKAVTILKDFSIDHRKITIFQNIKAVCVLEDSLI